MFCAVRHVRPERVGLKDHRHAAPLRRQAGDVAPGDQDPPGPDLGEAGDGAQQRGLAAAGRAEQGDELAGRHLERDALQHLDRAEGDLDPLDAQRIPGHPRTRSRRVRLPRAGPDASLPAEVLLQRVEVSPGTLGC